MLCDASFIAIYLYRTYGAGVICTLGGYVIKPLWGYWVLYGGWITSATITYNSIRFSKSFLIGMLCDASFIAIYLYRTYGAGVICTLGSHVIKPLWGYVI